jgi:hypothetical protein
MRKLKPIVAPRSLDRGAQYEHSSSLSCGVEYYSESKASLDIRLKELSKIAKQIQESASNYVTFEELNHSVYRDELGRVLWLSDYEFLFQIKKKFAGEIVNVNMIDPLYALYMLGEPI